MAAEGLQTEIAGSGDGESMCEPGRSAVTSISELVHEYHRVVYAYAYRLTGRVQDAEDLTQQTFLVAQQNLGQLREAPRAKAWLLAITRSQYCRLCRKKRPFLADDADIELDYMSESSDDDLELDGEKLQLVLQTMSAPFRTVILMYYMKQLSYREIADRLEVPIGTVMSRLARAKSKLRAELGAEAGDDAS